MIMNTITLTMGDWSYDGHNMTHVVAIETNLTKEELMKAYKAGSKKLRLKLDFMDDVASDYEDNSVPEELIVALEKHGLKREEFFETSWKDESVWTVDYDHYWQVWMFIAKLGDPDLQFSEVERTKANINIGGYGMFSQ